MAGQTCFVNHTLVGNLDKRLALKNEIFFSSFYGFLFLYSCSRLVPLNYEFSFLSKSFTALFSQHFAHVSNINIASLQAACASPTSEVRGPYVDPELRCRHPWIIVWVLTVYTI